MELLNALVVIGALGGLLYVVARFPRLFLMPMVRSAIWDLRDRAWDARWRGEIRPRSGAHLVDFSESMIAAITTTPPLIVRQIVDPRQAVDFFGQEGHRHDRSAARELSIEDAVALARGVVMSTELMYLVVKAVMVSTWYSILIWSPRRLSALRTLRRNIENARDVQSRLEDLEHRATAAKADPNEVAELRSRFARFVYAERNVEHRLPPRKLSSEQLAQFV